MTTPLEQAGLKLHSALLAYESELGTRGRLLPTFDIPEVWTARQRLYDAAREMGCLAGRDNPRRRRIASLATLRARNLAMTAALEHIARYVPTPGLEYMRSVELSALARAVLEMVRERGDNG